MARNRPNFANFHSKPPPRKLADPGDHSASISPNRISGLPRPQLARFRGPKWGAGRDLVLGPNPPKAGLILPDWRNGRESAKFRKFPLETTDAKIGRHGRPLRADFAESHFGPPLPTVGSISWPEMGCRPRPRFGA